MVLALGQRGGSGPLSILRFELLLLGNFAHRIRLLQRDVLQCTTGATGAPYAGVVRQQAQAGDPDAGSDRHREEGHLPGSFQVIQRLVLHAPNVHTGGGLVLLQALLSGWERKDIELTLILDQRAGQRLVIPVGGRATWVPTTARARLAAEMTLQQHANVPDCLVLCFHGLPPLLPNRAKNIVFQQNRNYLGLNPLSEFSGRTRIRLLVERMLSKAFRHRVSKYVVQTPTMQRELEHWFRSGRTDTKGPDAAVLPFMQFPIEASAVPAAQAHWDFSYVADGEAHKNHRNLLAAWILLAQEGMRPSLALTLTKRDDRLAQEIDEAVRIHRLSITNLMELSRAEIFRLYEDSRALIFPSTSESFGLPLIEATRAGIPIIASELDYVRDVCTPDQTFDPRSPTSIARAVKRYLKVIEADPELLTPAEFWNTLLKQSM